MGEGTEGKAAIELRDCPACRHGNTLSQKDCSDMPVLRGAVQDVICSVATPLWQIALQTCLTPPLQDGLSSNQALVEQKQKQRSEEVPKRTHLLSQNSLSHHPPLPSAQMTAAHELCNSRNLKRRGARGGKKRQKG